MKDGNASRQDFPASNEELFIPGNDIEILLGYQSQESTVFKGIITTHRLKVRRGGAELMIECKDPAVKMTIGEKSNYFFEQKDSDFIREIVESYELELEMDDSTVEHQEMVQFQTSDWDFVLSRAEANSFVVIVEDGTLYVEPPTIAEEADLEVAYGATIEEFDAEIDSRYQYTSVQAMAWDQVNQEIITADGTLSPAPAEQGNLTPEQLNGVIGIAPFTLFHAGKVDQNELQEWANAQLLKSKLSKVRGRVKIQGYADLLVGDTLGLSGVGERMSGNAYVSGIRHELSGGNWYTDIQFGLEPGFFTQNNAVHTPKAGGLLAGINGLQVGKVKGFTEDSEGLERVKVEFPIVGILNEEEGVFARIANIDAGPERGVIFHPEVGDEVIVGFINDDPRDPVILGMLHSSNTSTPIPVGEENPEKGIVTREQLKLLFNDEVKSVTVETPNGNKVVLSDEDGGILLEDENGNKVALSSSGITIESAADLILKAGGDVKLEGVNVEQKSSAQFKAEGGAGIEVSTSAIAVLKGSLVQIN
jgi:Rhs element Vgr protein